MQKQRWILRLSTTHVAGLRNIGRIETTHARWIASSLGTEAPLIRHVD